MAGKNKMKKIAVCISGLSRFWETTSKCFEYWNNLYDDIEFYFFLNTWKDDGVYQQKDKPLQEVHDYSQYSFLHSWELIDYEKIPENFIQKWDIRVLWAYALQEIHRLRRESNIDFDAVMQLSSDIFLIRTNLESTVRLINTGIEYGMGKNKTKFYDSLGDNLLYSVEGLSVNNNWSTYLPANKLSLVCTKLTVANPYTMDKYSELYKDVFLNNCIEDRMKKFHIMQGSYLNFRNVNVSPIPFVTEYINPLRLKNIKKGTPTIDRLEYIIDNYGLEFLYSNDEETKTLVKEYIHINKEIIL
jgi:hypothetical protein